MRTACLGDWKPKTLITECNTWPWTGYSPGNENAIKNIIGMIVKYGLRIRLRLNGYKFLDFDKYTLVR